MKSVLARMLTQMQATSADFPLHQEEPVVLESAMTKASTKYMVVDTLSLNNTCMGIAYTSPVDHNAGDGLLDGNTGTSDTKSELMSPDQLKFTDETSEAVSEELTSLNVNRSQTAVRPIAYKGSKN